METLASLALLVDTTKVGEAGVALDSLAPKIKSAEDAANRMTAAFKTLGDAGAKASGTATEGTTKHTHGTKALGDAVEKLNLSLESQLNAYKGLSSAIDHDLQLAMDSAVQRRVLNSLLATGAGVVDQVTVALAKEVEALRQEIATSTSLLNLQKGLTDSAKQQIRASEEKRIAKAAYIAELRSEGVAEQATAATVAAAEKIKQEANLAGINVQLKYASQTAIAAAGEVDAKVKAALAIAAAERTKQELLGATMAKAIERRIALEQGYDVKMYAEKAKAADASIAAERTKQELLGATMAKAIERRIALEQGYDVKMYAEKAKAADASIAAERRRQELLGAEMAKGMGTRAQMEKQDMEMQKIRWASAGGGGSPTNIFQATGIRSPEAVAKELEQLRQVRGLWEEAGKKAEGYAGAIAGITARTNVLTEGNARARGAIRETAAAMASLAFEAAGAAFLVSAVTAMIVAPTMPGIGLMKEIENTKLGMAAILVSMGRIHGMAPDLPQALRISQGMMEKLVSDSMRFGVSIEALANTLRATLAPGLGAGMNLEQIQKIATIGTIAVKTIGLDARQTVQEIRDLVAGGIQAASSTLATSLGIKDSDVKRWREAGTLYEELMKRMQGFASAAEESTKTLTGAWDVLKTKVALLMSDEKGFAAIKETILSISNYIGHINEQTGKMEFNQELLATAKAYWSILTSVGSVLGSLGALAKELAPIINAVAGAIALAIKGISMLVGEIRKAIAESLSLPGISMPNRRYASGVIGGATVIGGKYPVDKGAGAADVTGNWDTQVATILQQAETRLKHTREGIVAEYEKTLNAVKQEQKLLATGRADLASMEQKALGLSGKDLEDINVNMTAKRTALDTLNKLITTDAVNAKKVRDEKLKALDEKENKVSPFQKEFDDLAKSRAGIQAHNAALEKEIELTRQGLSGTAALVGSNKFYAEEQIKVAELLLGHKIKTSEADRLLAAAELKDIDAAKTARLTRTKEEENSFAKATDAAQKHLVQLEAEVLATDKATMKATAYAQALAAVAKAKLEGTPAGDARLGVAALEDMANLTLGVKGGAANLQSQADKAWAAANTIPKMRKEEQDILRAAKEVQAAQTQFDEATSRYVSEILKGRGSAQGSTFVAEAAKQLTAAKVAADALTASYIYSRTAESGAKNALTDYIDNIGSAATSMHKLFTDALKGMEDALVSFAKTGKLDFTSLTNSIITDLIRMQVQASITAPFAAFLKTAYAGWEGSPGFVGPPSSSAGGGMNFQANGNVFSGPGIAAYSNQIVSQPTMFGSGGNVMGEAGPEAIMPLTRGPGGKLGVQSSGGAPQIQFNVVNQSGTEVKATPSGAPQFDGEKWVVGVVLSAVQNNPSVRNSLAAAMR